MTVVPSGIFGFDDDIIEGGFGNHLRDLEASGESVVGFCLLGLENNDLIATMEMIFCAVFGILSIFQ